MKIKYVVIHAVIILFCFAIIPIDLFVAFFPEWITICFSICSILSLVLFYLKGKGKLHFKVILTGITVFTIVFSLFGSYCNPYWNSINYKKFPDTVNFNKTLTFEQAKEDTDYMMKYLNKVHPLFLNGEPSNIHNAYQKAISELKSTPNITVSVLNRKLQSIVSLLHDGHTEIYGDYQNMHYLKQTYWRNENGYQLVQVNGVSIPDLFSQKSNLFSYDYESFGIKELEEHLSTLENLNYLGIDANGLKYTYKDNAGKTDTVSYHASDFLTYDKYCSYNHISKDSQNPFVSYKIDQNKDAAVLTLNSCDFNDVYCKCLNAMFREIKEKGIQNIAVDLRGNGGGNSQVADEFMRYLNIDTYSEGSDDWRFGFFMLPSGENVIKNKKHAGLTFYGNVYVLTSVDTFSSAMLFSKCIQENKLGKIIGDAPGEKIAGYGDVAEFVLPNSKLCFQASTKKFNDKLMKKNQLTPDIACSSQNALNLFFETIKSKQ